MDDILGYTLPTLAVKNAVETALRIDNELNQSFPDLFMRNFRCPSEQLVICGARALDTYYELGKDFSEKKVAILETLLRKHGLHLELWPDEPRQNNVEKYYTLINLEALHRMSKDYQTLPEWHDWDATGSFYVWFDAWRKRIATHYSPLIMPRVSKKICEQIAHDIAFGALLGYPGKAITAIALDQSMYDEKDTYTDVKIAHMKDFNGAWVSYSINRSHLDDPQITSHRAYWSDILNALYANPIFTDV